MRRFLIAVTAAVALPAVVLPTSADAQRTYSRGRHYHRHQICSHSGGTTGAVAGTGAGLLAGHGIFGHGAAGTIAGGVGGFFAGRAIDRTITAHRRCTHYY